VVSAHKGLTALLMLADSRLPAGGHAHSGGVEPAVSAGLLRDVDDLTVFLRGRLRSQGVVAAAIAAAACDHAARRGDAEVWTGLDAETDARTPSPAQRLTSRTQGRALVRAGRAAQHAPVLERLAGTPGGPHHPVVLGAVGAAMGCPPAGVAHVAAYLAVSGPASAAVRLCGFDPLAVHALLAALAPEVDAVAAQAAGTATGPLRDLPCAAAPRLDLLAEQHTRMEVRLFAS
jgi:urease accessory protein